MWQKLMDQIWAPLKRTIAHGDLIMNLPRKLFNIVKSITIRRLEFGDRDTKNRNCQIYTLLHSIFLCLLIGLIVLLSILLRYERSNF